jgi:hypothetical protein
MKFTPSGGVALKSQTKAGKPEEDHNRYATRVLRDNGYLSPVTLARCKRGRLVREDKHCTDGKGEMPIHNRN